MLQRVKPPSQPAFLFSVIDTATGRELQDEPTHNLASLGIANGERPFRRLPIPSHFFRARACAYKSSSRARARRERCSSFSTATGFPIGASCPEPVARSLTRPVRAATQRPVLPPAEVVPFDYVASLELTGTAGARQDSEITVSVSNEFVATAVGYGLASGDLDVAVGVDDGNSQLAVARA